MTEAGRKDMTEALENADTTQSVDTGVHRLTEMEIVIEEPNWSNYSSISVANFGARAEEGYCNGEAFQRAIDYCKQANVAELTVPAGVYHFYEGRHPVFEGLQDFQFDGGESEFIFSTVSAYFVIKYCTRAIFKNFTLDWNWARDQLASIGQVQEVATDRSYIDLHFPEYETLPEKLDIRTFNAMDPRTLSPGCSLGREFGHDQLGTAVLKDRNTLRISLPEAKREFFHFLQREQTYIVRHYIYDANAFELHGNQHLQMQHVTIYSAPGHGFVTTGDQHHWALERCRIVKRPGTTRCISVTADGCHISNSQGYFRIENCDFSYNGDDCLNIHDNSVQGFVRVDDRTIQLSRVQRWRNPFGKDDAIEFRLADLSPAGLTVPIESVDWEEEQQRCTVVFQEPLPADLSNQAILFNRRYDSGHYIVRNNFFHHNRARGILLHSSHGLVENNHFLMNQGSAIQIECGAESRWAEGFGVEHVIIRNNLIDSSDVNHWNMAVIYMGVYLEQGRTLFPIFQNITIESNTIVNCPQQAMYMSSCNHIVIRSNAILNDNAGPIKTEQDGDANCVANRSSYQGSLMVSHGRDIEISGNRRLSTLPATDSGIYIEPLTSSNVTLTGNVGFQ
ncbi:hypothetical protein BVG16_28985 [Paenibacillus selenitireducens]|uniref:Right handed beta helix domain-containing protein n=1 Tax=Paenibacillus selenitireducens TaxID=1324314 RepID=A0A1T2X0H3_9BACL|nr:hypothetical protein BVG16_28985 [Paenibacillus selenitireducens]